MNRLHAAVPALLAALSCLFHCAAHAQDVFKWTDANGKVHYGDRAAAPEDSKQIVVPAAPTHPRAVLPTMLTAPSVLASEQRRLGSRLAPQAPSIPVAANRVGPACKGLIDQIAAVPAGTNWKALSQQFNSACPGIAYECVEYVSSPDKNRCTWIERSGGTVLQRNKFP